MLRVILYIGISFFIKIAIACNTFADGRGSQISNHYVAIGYSSWYGDHFHGNQTASGIFFDKNSYGAAHRSLPFFSLIRVTNLHNKKNVVLMIIDRGPFYYDRILDVSENIASILGFRKSGKAEVKIEYLEKETKSLMKLAPSKKPRALFHFFMQHRKMFDSHIKEIKNKKQVLNNKRRRSSAGRAVHS